MEAEPGTAGKVICSAGHILAGRTSGEMCGKDQRSGGATWFKCDGTLRPYPDRMIEAKDVPALKEAMRQQVEIPAAIASEGDRDLLRDMRQYLGGVVAGSIIGNDAETQAEVLIGRISEMIDGGGRGDTA